MDPEARGSCRAENCHDGGDFGAFASTTVWSLSCQVPKTALLQVNPDDKTFISKFIDRIRGEVITARGDTRFSVQPPRQVDLQHLDASLSHHKTKKPSCPVSRRRHLQAGELLLLLPLLLPRLHLRYRHLPRLPRHLLLASIRRPIPKSQSLHKRRKNGYEIAEIGSGRSARRASFRLKRPICPLST